MTEYIQCRGNRRVVILDEDHWSVPFGVGTRATQVNLDFTRLPPTVRGWWRAVLRSSYASDTLALAYNVWHTALWFARYQADGSGLRNDWDAYRATDWGTYALWLKGQSRESGSGSPLSHNTRRGHFTFLAVAARHAMQLGLDGVSDVTIERLRAVSRRAFRGGNALIQERIARRALTSDQYTDLYAIMSEEWGWYREWEAAPHAVTFTEYTGWIPDDLSPLVACWLAFNDGVRSSEMGNLTVDDVVEDRVHGNHELRVHAPNKDDDVLPIEKDTLALLQALIRHGETTRSALGTRLLFVRTHRPLTTVDLTRGMRAMVARHAPTSLPDDLKLPDGRTTLGTLVALEIPDREMGRRIMRHKWQSTTDMFYRARKKVVVAGHIARALRGEALRLTMACQRPIIHLSERPDQVDILARNPGNADLEHGHCGRDIQRQGACEEARHCFECPLLVPWVSKRHNYVNERDEYVRLAEEADNPRDRENRLYHASLAEAYIVLIDRRLAVEEGRKNGRLSPERPRRRAPRRPGAV